MNLVDKCIKNAKERIMNPKNKMNAYSYINYFVKRNELSSEDDFYIRSQVDEFLDEIITVNFTVNGMKI